MKTCLEMLSQARPEVDGSCLATLPDGVAEELLEAGFLQPGENRGAMVCQACHGDHMVDIEFDPVSRTSRYFCPEAGWTQADKNAMRVFRVDLDATVKHVARLLGVSARRAPPELVREHFWDLGNAWIGGSRASDRRKTSLFVARRADHVAVRDQIVTALANRTRRAPAAVLLLSTGDHQPSMAFPQGCTALSVWACRVAGTKAFSLDAELIAARIHDLPRTPSSGPVRASPDYRTVQVGSRIFEFQGDKHRQVVRYLHDAWERGLAPVSTATMFTDLGFESSSRLRDLFKGHSDWMDLVGRGRGACWLKVDELLRDEQANLD